MDLAPASEWEANASFIKLMYKQSDSIKRALSAQLVRPAFKEEFGPIAAEAQAELDSQ